QFNEVPLKTAASICLCMGESRCTDLTSFQCTLKTKKSRAQLTAVRSPELSASNTESQINSDPQPEGSDQAWLHGKKMKADLPSNAMRPAGSTMRQSMLIQSTCAKSNLM